MFKKDSARRELGDFRADRRMLLLAFLALPIGTLSAFLAKALLWLIAVVTNLAFFQKFSSENVGLEQHHLGAWVIIVPVIGAIIIGLMARYGSEKIRGHGIPEALEAILLGRSLINPKVAILKPLSSAISIGTGGPFGAEGPIIMTGGAFGSLFAQLFHLTAAERKTLLVAGAAGGMSAVFATPVAAVLLAVELLLFEWRPRSLIPVAVSALAASLWRVWLLGEGPVFAVHPHLVIGSGEAVSAIILGLVVGLGAAGVTSLVYWFEDLFRKFPVHWMWWPAMGAVVVGVAGYFDPRVMGVGYDTIHALLRGELTSGVVVGFLIMKTLVWAVALGSGTSGGVLAPLLLIGGSLGALLSGWLPAGDAGLWAMTGMAAMMGGTMRAPLTGMIFTVELTHDFMAMPILLTACACSLTVTVLLLRRSILTEKLARRGQHISQEYSVDQFELLRVGDVMDKEIPSVSPQTTVAELAFRITADDPQVSRRQGVVLLDERSELCGILTRRELLLALQQEPTGKQTVLSIAKTSVVTAFPDEVLNDVIERMLQFDIGRLPVVSREHPKRVIGYLGRAGILASRQKNYHEEAHREHGPLKKALA